jgi:molybdopterin/thiamine biosynthesis adenylyltransferase
MITATDNLASRFDADRFARQLLIPLVDAGINIQLAGGRISRIGGRVSVSYPTGACLSCMGIIDPDALAAEADPLGYRGLGGAEEAAVAAYNAVVAGLAVVQGLELLIPFASPGGSRDFRYDGLASTVREISVPPPNHCRLCGDMAGSVTGELP